MNHPHSLPIAFPPALLHCILRMQQLVVTRDLTTLHRYEATWREASNTSMPAPTDLLDEVASMQTWIQQSRAFFSAQWLFPNTDTARGHATALINALSQGDEQLASLLTQLQSLPAFISASTQALLLAQLEAVERTYTTIAEGQIAFGEQIEALVTPDDATDVQNAASPATETGALDQLGTMTSSFLAALGLGSLPVSIYPARQQIRVNDQALTIRHIQRQAKTPDWVNVPGWVSVGPQTPQEDLVEAPELLWELAAPVAASHDQPNERCFAVAHARSIREAAIEAALWFLRRVLWQQRHIRLLPIRAGQEIALDDDTLLEEQTVSVYHLVVVCQAEHVDWLLDRLQRLLGEHQVHASLVDRVTSIKREETTLHFFADDPFSEIIEAWLRKTERVIDYSLAHPTFHLTIEDEKPEN